MQAQTSLSTALQAIGHSGANGTHYVHIDTNAEKKDVVIAALITGLALVINVELYPALRKRVWPEPEPEPASESGPE